MGNAVIRSGVQSVSLDDTDSKASVRMEILILK